MKAKNHNTNREKRVMKKRFRTAVFLLLFAGIGLTVFRYFKLVSKTVYEESVSHLTEVFHQSDNMLRELTDKNLTYLHMWGAYLQETSDEDKIRDYIENAQKDAGFLNFYFLSTDGNYKMLTGETGYLDLQENFEDEIQNGNDIVTNVVVPGKSQMLVFASPRPRIRHVKISVLARHRCRTASLQIVWKKRISAIIMIILRIQHRILSTRLVWHMQKRSVLEQESMN